MKRSRTTADGASTDAGHRPAPAPPQETTSESLVQSLQEFRAKFTVTREVLATSRKKAAESRKEEALLRKAGEAASTTPAKPASAVVWPAPLATLPRAFTKAGRKPKPAPIFPKLPKFSGDDAEDFWEWRGALCDKYEEDEDEFESPEDWYKYVFSYLETQVQDRVLKRMGSVREEERSGWLLLAHLAAMYDREKCQQTVDRLRAIRQRPDEPEKEFLKRFQREIFRAGYSSVRPYDYAMYLDGKEEEEEEEED